MKKYVLYVYNGIFEGFIFLLMSEFVMSDYFYYYTDKLDILSENMSTVGVCLLPVICALFSSAFFCKILKNGETKNVWGRIWGCISFISVCPAYLILTNTFHMNIFPTEKVNNASGIILFLVWTIYFPSLWILKTIISSFITDQK